MEIGDKEELKDITIVLLDGRTFLYKEISQVHVTDDNIVLSGKDAKGEFEMFYPIKNIESVLARPS